MLLTVIRIVYLCVCIGAIVTYVSAPGADRPELVEGHRVGAFFVLLAISLSAVGVDFIIRQKRIEVISAVYFGLLVGVLLSYLLILALEPVVPAEYRGMVVTVTLLALPYLCISMLLQTKDDFRFIIPYVEFARELKGGRPLVLDSSALIDGRIADVVETRMFESEIMVPQLVLREVQEIAESGDRLRRSRGRRGLDVLSRLQNYPHCEVKVTEHDGALGKSIDEQLVHITKQSNGRIVTNDFNLNKVATVQGVDVINLNDLANAVKPRYLPGERTRITVRREGDSVGQGVGYLDDGTMVVCEQASDLIGKEVDIEVTRVLQTSAGRMIFARPLKDEA